MTTTTRQVERVPLPDGSVAVVEPTGTSSAIISREVNGRCVWGQAFAAGHDGDLHAEQVERVLAGMADDPAGFCRWWLA